MHGYDAKILDVQITRMATKKGKIVLGPRKSITTGPGLHAGEA